jgi:cytosine/adenosine deaminase-related metal-dependent hydrolase
VFCSFVLFVCFVAVVNHAVGSFSMGRQLLDARWVLPISEPPIANGRVEIENGRIVGVGPRTRAHSTPSSGIAILPGLVNAHTHLELSYLHERIPSAPSFGQWVSAVMKARSLYADPADPTIVESARASIAAALAAGTVLFGDISNTLVTVPLLRERGVAAQVFHELTGFTEQDPEARVREARARADAAAGGDIRVSVAPHAPYSVSADLFRAIRADLDAHADAVSSVHLGETPEEIELLQHGRGAIRQVLENLGRWPADWRPPGVGPVDYLAELGVLDSRMLAVHGVQFEDHDLRRLRDLGVTVVSCPRSNVYVGVGSPPLAAFYAAGLDVAFGTDSLASAPDLNLFAELQEARRIAPSVSARRLLESATATGARALGFGAELGTIEPGKRARLIAVDVPDEVRDVEEYLLSGIASGQVRVL